MNSDYTDTKTSKKKGAVQILDERADARVIRLSLHEASELSIAEESDDGGDPYNSTGQHVVIKDLHKR